MTPDEAWLLVGLVAIAFKTIRALRARVKAALDVIKLETEGKEDNGSEEDAEERKRKTAVAATEILDSECRVDMLSKWWVLFALLHFASTSFVGSFLPYAVELRSLLLIIGLLPLQLSYRVIERAFINVASPICGKLIPQFSRWVWKKNRLAISFLSPLLRAAISAALSGPILAYCPDASLNKAEGTLDLLSQRLTQERRKRRTRALLQGMPLELESASRVATGLVDDDDGGEEDSAAGAGRRRSKEELNALPPHQRHYLCSPRNYFAFFNEGSAGFIDGTTPAVAGAGGGFFPLLDEWEADFLDDDEITVGAGAGGSAGINTGGFAAALSPLKETPQPPPGRKLTAIRKTAIAAAGAGGSSHAIAQSSSETDEEQGAAVGGIVSSFSRGLISALGGGTPRHGGGNSNNDNGLLAGRPPRPAPMLAGRGATRNVVMASGRLSLGGGGGEAPLTAPHAVGGRARFRQSAGAAGLVPAAAPGNRTLLWTPQAATPATRSRVALHEETKEGSSSLSSRA